MFIPCLEVTYTDAFHIFPLDGSTAIHVCLLFDENFIFSSCTYEKRKTALCSLEFKAVFRHTGLNHNQGHRLRK